jgi:peptidoglycan lytic transglycosylase G
VPLGDPHEDAPRLVAARGFPSDHDAVHAFAASRPDTAEHESTLDTGEHGPPEETEVRPPAPLRKAPDRPAEAGAARRRPAPNAPRGRSRPPKAPKGPRTGGGAHWGRRIFTLLVVVVFVAVLYTFNKTFQPFHGDGTGSVVVNIPQNTDASDVAKLLADKGVVDSARFFELKASISGDRGKLRPGHYTLKKGMTNSAAIAALTKVPANPKAAATVDVTIIEGPSIKENDPVVKKSEKVEGSYAKAASSSAVLKRIRGLGAPKGTKTAEGFLFPATYKLKVGAPASELVNEQLGAFEDNFKQIDMKYAKSKKLTRYDVLIIASMIEREAQVARERPLVSAVIYNRLKQGMPLAIDATTRYATNNWERPILQSELDKQGPYNTRLKRGLPPTPIGNPGLASLKAAAKPSSKKYLFYVRKPGKSGEHAFSSTDAQFEKDVAKYNASRKGK